jgi:hypothetical protein
MDQPSVVEFLLAYPDWVRQRADQLRALVQRAAPDAIERVRPGWRLIGFDLAVGRRKRYFAYISPETEHVHLGFEHGALLADPQRMLEGAHLGLRQVRYLTYWRGDTIPRRAVLDLIRRAAALALMSRAERSAMALVADLQRPARE